MIKGVKDLEFNWNQRAEKYSGVIFLEGVRSQTPQKTWKEAGKKSCHKRFYFGVIFLFPFEKFSV